MAETEEGHRIASSPPAEGAWSQVWHVPVLLLGLLLLGIGVYVALPSADTDDFPAALDSVRAYLLAGNLAKAAELLDVVDGRIDRASKADRTRSLLLRGDLRHAEEAVEQWVVPSRVTRIIEAYEAAEVLGYDLAVDEVRLERMARMYASTGRTAEAMAVVERLKDAVPSRRYGVLKRIIQHAWASAVTTPPEDLIALVTRYRKEVREEPDPDQRRDAQIWGLSIQARLYLDDGDPGRALDFLNPRRANLASVGGEEDLGPLIVLQAESLRRVGDYDAADVMFQHAQLKLAHDPTSVLHAEILVGQAQIALAHRGEVDTALEHFRNAATRFPTAPGYPTALIGMADCEARSGADARAEARFREAAEHLATSSPRDATAKRMLVEMIVTHYQRHFDMFRYEQALRYLRVLPLLYDQHPPTDLLARFAETHQRIAESRLSHAAEAGSAVEAEAPDRQDTEDDTTDPAAEHVAADDPEAARRLARREAAMHFGEAAQFYYNHARSVTVSDDQAHGSSLWNAAINFDRARLWERAIEVLEQFQQTRPSDPRRLDASIMLATAHQANGDHRVAVEHFDRLIQSHPRTRQAHASRVPLARCHIALGQLNKALAELNHVVENNDVVTPDSKEYLASVIELGRLHYRMEQYEAAISRLQEAVDRDPDSPEIGLLYGYLADAYRMSVPQLDAVLAEAVTRSQSEVLSRERTRRLEQAKEAFDHAIDLLEVRPAAVRTPLEELYLRNSYFYRGDCDFMLERYESSIALYHEAVKRWDQHPGSLVAWMQIVNAHCALQQFQDAKVELGNAQFALQRMPENAFDDPNLPISREHWKQWFHWTSELGIYAQADAETGEP